jgi:hypothetical protein
MQNLAELRSTRHLALRERFLLPLDQVPKVSVQILENGDRAVGLFLGFADEFNLSRDEGLVVAPEVVSVQEEEYAAAGLVSDACDLFRSGRLREEDARRLGTGGRYENPALICTQIRVFDDMESEDIGVEGDGLVVVANHDRDVCEVLRHELSFYGSRGACARREFVEPGCEPCDSTPGSTLDHRDV